MPLIVFEGIDGCGKTTQLQRTATWARERGQDPLCLREPGGTPLGERLRELLLDPLTQANPVAELFAYQVARAQLCGAVIAPALAEGRLVLLDRFWYSTLAYQGSGLGLEPAAVRTVVALAAGSVRADVALWYDVPPAVAQRRRAIARGQEDRIEARGLQYLERVRTGYAALAEEGLLTRLDGTVDPEAVWTQTHGQLTRILP